MTKAAASAGPTATAVRVQARDGRWAVARVALVTGSPRLARGFAVTIEPARPADLAPLLMRAWELSARERDVAVAIDGLPGPDIAAALFISPHTARDHLKAIFTKTGVHRRRDLAAVLTGQPARSPVTSAPGPFSGR